MVMQTPLFKDDMVVTIREMAARIAELETQVLAMDGKVEAAREFAQHVFDRLDYVERLLGHAASMYPEVKAVCTAVRVKQVIGAADKK